jgi:glycosyltransferase involved in cell wall biosynthesis
MKVIIDGIIYQLQSQGGISRIFSEILPRMCNLDDSVRITLLTEGELRQSLPENRHIIHRRIPPVKRYLRPGRLWKPIIPRARQLMLRVLVGRGDGHIWHSTYYTQPGHWDGLQVVTVADMIYERFSDLFNGPRNDQFREEKRRCVQEADAVICISETTRQDVLHFYKLDSNSTYVVPLACSDIFRRLKQRGNDPETLTKQPFLLYVGSRAHYKNFDRLIQAYSVWAYRNEVALVVVGSSWSASEELWLAELGIQDHMHLLTDVDDEKLRQLYSQAAAFVYPSLYEGFGIPLLEAMACGCPVIASHIPSTIEVAGECPIYFEPTKVDELINAFDVALSEGRDSECTKAGLERVKQYSWDKTAAQTLEVYRTISERLE